MVTSEGYFLRPRSSANESSNASATSNRATCKPPKQKLRSVKQPESELLLKAEEKKNGYIRKELVASRELIGSRKELVGWRGEKSGFVEKRGLVAKKMRKVLLAQHHCAPTVQLKQCSRNLTRQRSLKAVGVGDVSIRTALFTARLFQHELPFFLA